MQPGAQLPPPPPQHLAVAAAPIKPSPAVHIVGGILTVVAIAAGLVASALAAFNFDRPCDGSDAPASHVLGLRISLAGITLVVAAVPATTAYVGRHRQQPWKPWMAIAAALTLTGLAIAVSADPQTGFCF